MLENPVKVHKTRNPYIKGSKKKRASKYQLSVLLVIQFEEKTKPLKMLPSANKTEIPDR